MCPLQLGSLSKVLNCYYEKIMVRLNPKKFIKTLTAKKTNTEKLAEKMSKYWQNNSDILYVKELDDNFCI